MPKEIAAVVVGCVWIRNGWRSFAGEFSARLRYALGSARPAVRRCDSSTELNRGYRDKLVLHYEVGHGTYKCV